MDCGIFRISLFVALMNSGVREEDQWVIASWRQNVLLRTKYAFWQVCSFDSLFVRLYKCLLFACLYVCLSGWKITQNIDQNFTHRSILA